MKRRPRDQEENGPKQKESENWSGTQMPANGETISDEPSKYFSDYIYRMWEVRTSIVLSPTDNLIAKFSEITDQIYLEKDEDLPDSEKRGLSTLCRAFREHIRFTLSQNATEAMTHLKNTVRLTNAPHCHPQSSSLLRMILLRDILSLDIISVKDLFVLSRSQRPTDLSPRLKIIAEELLARISVDQLQQESSAGPSPMSTLRAWREKIRIEVNVFCHMHGQRSCGSKWQEFQNEGQWFCLSQAKLKGLIEESLKAEQNLDNIPDLDPSARRSYMICHSLATSAQWLALLGLGAASSIEDPFLSINKIFTHEPVRRYSQGASDDSDFWGTSAALRDLLKVSGECYLSCLKSLLSEVEVATPESRNESNKLIAFIHLTVLDVLSWFALIAFQADLRTALRRVSKEGATNGGSGIEHAAMCVDDTKSVTEASDIFIERISEALTEKREGIVFMEYLQMLFPLGSSFLIELRDCVCRLVGEVTPHKSSKEGGSTGAAKTEIKTFKKALEEVDKCSAEYVKIKPRPNTQLDDRFFDSRWAFHYYCQERKRALVLQFEHLRHADIPLSFLPSHPSTSSNFFMFKPAVLMGTARNAIENLYDEYALQEESGFALTRRDSGQ